MRRLLAPVLGLLVALTWADLSAQQQACTMLTAADVEKATGAKLLEPHPTNLIIPEGPQKGQPVNGCMWGVPGNGMVSISVMPVPQGASRQEGMAKLEEVYGQLKAKHWTQERKDYTDGSCSVFSPPPAEKDAPILSGCVAESKGVLISSTFMSPTQKLSMEQNRALLDKVKGHLH